MLEKLKEEVLKANLLLPKYNLVEFTWGNVSVIDRETNLVIIKPSGVDYDLMTIDDLVVVDLEGNIVEGKNNPSTDTPTHCYLYQKFKDVQSITHTHSKFATSWAQAGIDLPILGTTHADNFYGDVPCTPHLKVENIKDDYELETGKLIYQTFIQRNLTPNDIPAILVNNHGVFTFGKTGIDSVKNAKILEIVSEMSFYTYSINQDKNKLDQSLIDKHYQRKHGKNAYYGQSNKK